MGCYTFVNSQDRLQTYCCNRCHFNCCPDRHERVDSIAVIGPESQLAKVGGSGSSDVESFYVVDPLSAIEEYAGEDVTVNYEPSGRQAFEKVRFKPGETTTITFELDQDAFSFYSESKGEWVIEPGEFELLIGRSSREIEHTQTVTLTDEADESETSSE